MRPFQLLRSKVIMYASLADPDRVHDGQDSRDHLFVEPEAQVNCIIEPIEVKRRGRTKNIQVVKAGHVLDSAEQSFVEVEDAPGAAGIRLHRGI